MIPTPTQLMKTLVLTDERTAELDLVLTATLVGSKGVYPITLDTKEYRVNALELQYMLKTLNSRNWEASTLGSVLTIVPAAPKPRRKRG